MDWSRCSRHWRWAPHTSCTVIVTPTAAYSIESRESACTTIITGTTVASGLTQVRLQSYFPFHVHVVLNGSSAEAGLAWPTEPTVEARASAAYGILQGCAGGLLLDERTDRVGHGRIVP